MVDDKNNLSMRPWSWNAKNHMLYIDNPVSLCFTCYVQLELHKNINEQHVSFRRCVA